MLNTSTVRKRYRKGFVFIGARVPTEVKDRLLKKAKRSRRSLSAETEVALTNYVALEI